MATLGHTIAYLPALFNTFYRLSIWLFPKIGMPRPSNHGFPVSPCWMSITKKLNDFGVQHVVNPSFLSALLPLLLYCRCWPSCDGILRLRLTCLSLLCFRCCCMPLEGSAQCPCTYGGIQWFMTVASNPGWSIISSGLVRCSIGHSHHPLSEYLLSS